MLLETPSTPEQKCQGPHLNNNFHRPDAHMVQTIQLQHQCQHQYPTSQKNVLLTHIESFDQ